MTLRRKSLLIHMFTMLAILLLLDFAFTGSLRKMADKADRDRLFQDLARTVVAINGEARTLAAIASNWAFSDATWNYMHGTNPGYPATVLNRDVLTKVGISSMIFIDNYFHIKHFKDFSSTDEPSPPDAEFAAIFEKSGVQGYLGSLGADGVSGIAMNGEEPILYSIKPILNSDMNESSAGYLIVTRAINPSLIMSISDSMLGFRFYVEKLTPEEAKLSSDLPTTIINSGEKSSMSMSGRMVVKDHAGSPAFWVCCNSKKTIDVVATEKKLHSLFLIFGAVAFIICLLLDLQFNHSVSRRLKRLSKELESGRGDSATDFITVDKGNDEITSLQHYVNDAFAYHNFNFNSRQYDASQVDKTAQNASEQNTLDSNRFSRDALRDIAVAFTPGDEKFRNSIPRAADMMDKFCTSLGLNEEERFNARIGALFSRIGKLSLPSGILGKSPERRTAQETRSYMKYPIYSRDILSTIDIMRKSVSLPYGWHENWDGTGFPQGLSGSAIPLDARAFAIVNEWNELTRHWPGRRLPSHEEVVEKLRALAGTRFDPNLTEKFIQLLESMDKERK